jgi:hypothetical protein
MVIASDLAPYSLIASALNGLVTGVSVQPAGAAAWAPLSTEPGPAYQSLPWDGYDGGFRLRVAFAGEVFVQGQDVSVQTSAGPGYTPGQLSPGAFTRTFDAATNTTTATWTFSGPMEADPLLIDVHSSIAGGPAAGATGGVIGGDFVLPVIFLPGDVNGDRIVDALDQTLFSAALGQPVTGLSRFDFDGNGTVDAADQAVLTAHMGGAVWNPGLHPSPSAPSGLTAYATGSDGMLVSWQPVAGARTLVQRSAGGAAFRTVADLDPGVAQFQDTGLTAGKAYAYRLVSADPTPAPYGYPRSVGLVAADRAFGAAGRAQIPTAGPVWNTRVAEAPGGKVVVAGEGPWRPRT